MRHHPKSNNGVFSKKQKQASRMMMRTRGTEIHSHRKYEVSSLKNKSSIMEKAMRLAGRGKRALQKIVGAEKV